MHEVFFKDPDLKIKVSPGTSILEAARKAGILVESPCNGSGVCGKCLVRVREEDLKHLRTGKNETYSIRDGIVLSCHSYIYGDLAVERIFAAGKEEGLKIIDSGHSIPFNIQPVIDKKYATLENKTFIYSGGVLVAVENGDSSGSKYGIVVDIGTTTLVLSLYNLVDSMEISSISRLNPQARHAQDVLSRIKFASEPSGLDQMHSILIMELNDMITELLLASGIARDYIYEAVFSGNSTMLYLAAGRNPEALGKYPYSMEMKGACHFKAKDIGLKIADSGLLYFPPLISAYVGADISSGILATGIYETTDVVLFVDVGTNGEMVLSSKGKLFASSTAAGPAFEGMNITFGMRAASGAIEEVKFEKGKPTFKTIGNTDAIGICGSGLIDAVGELAANGIIDRNGRFRNGAPGVFETPESKKIFSITESVYLTQKDIRHLQLAKGAVRTGIEMLLRDAGLSYDEVDRVLIAGSFGYHLRTDSLINIGLLPPAFREKVYFVGNTSKSGGTVQLLDGKRRKTLTDIVNDISIVELASKPEFEKLFVKSLCFEQEENNHE